MSKDLLRGLTAGDEEAQPGLSYLGALDAADVHPETEGGRWEETQHELGGLWEEDGPGLRIFKPGDNEHLCFFIRVFYITFASVDICKWYWIPPTSWTGTASGPVNGPSSYACIKTQPARMECSTCRRLFLWEIPLNLSTTRTCRRPAGDVVGRVMEIRTVRSSPAGFFMWQGTRQRIVFGRPPATFAVR